jgi:hypothetical protein
MGVTRSDGVIYDFAGDVNVDHMAFGWPTRYIQVSPERAAGLRDVNLSKRSGNSKPLSGGRFVPCSL